MPVCCLAEAQPWQSKSSCGCTTLESLDNNVEDEGNECEKADVRDEISALPPFG